MCMVTVRDLDPGVKEKLRARATRRGRSMEAEIRAILAAAVEVEEPEEGLGHAIVRIFGDVPAG